MERWKDGWKERKREKQETDVERRRDNKIQIWRECNAMQNAEDRAIK